MGWLFVIVAGYLQEDFWKQAHDSWLKFVIAFFLGGGGLLYCHKQYFQAPVCQHFFPRSNNDHFYIWNSTLKKTRSGEMVEMELERICLAKYWCKCETYFKVNQKTVVINLKMQSLFVYLPWYIPLAYHNPTVAFFIQNIYIYLLLFCRIKFKEKALRKTTGRKQPWYA